MDEDSCSMVGQRAMLVHQHDQGTQNVRRPALLRRSGKDGMGRSVIGHAGPNQVVQGHRNTTRKSWSIVGGLYGAARFVNALRCGEAGDGQGPLQDETPNRQCRP